MTEADTRAKAAAALPYLQHVGEQLLNVNNIWTAVEVLTNALGSKVGRHLETLLCQESCASPPIPKR